MPEPGAAYPPPRRHSRGPTSNGFQVRRARHLLPEFGIEIRSPGLKSRISKRLPARSPTTDSSRSFLNASSSMIRDMNDPSLRTQHLSSVFTLVTAVVETPGKRKRHVADQNIRGLDRDNRPSCQPGIPVLKNKPGVSPVRGGRNPVARTVRIGRVPGVCFHAAQPSLQRHPFRQAPVDRHGLRIGIRCRDPSLEMGLRKCRFCVSKPQARPFHQVKRHLSVPFAYDPEPP